MRLSKVDLPQPLAPIRAIFSPFLISNDRFSKSILSSKLKLTQSTKIGKSDVEDRSSVCIIAS